MTEQASPAAPNNGSAPRNIFSATGISVTGIVREVSSKDGKDGKQYHDLMLTTAHNAELRISLAAAPDPSRYQVGALAKVMVRLRSWQKDGRSGTLLLEVPA